MLRKITITATNELVNIDCICIGSFTSHWRKRVVEIFDHPVDLDLVVTVGKGFEDGSDCNSIEPRETYKNCIGKFNEVHQ